jgi:UDP-GlcNAc:undecaprenyl-phosphate GlcNAc-1-phosphate transferase
MLALATVLLTALITPVVRVFCLCAALVDQPDGIRKLHRSPVARMGGIALMFAWAAAVGLASFSADPGERAFAKMAMHLTPAVVVMFAGGIYDDLFRLSPWQKLVVQAAGAGGAYAAGVRFDTIAGWQIPPAVAGVLTIVWLVSISNAFNLIDGMDGLAAGLGILVSATMSAAGCLLGDPVLAITGTVIASSLAAFFFYNAPPASIFMGDSGSLTLGFLFGCASIWWSRIASPAGWLAPFILLAIPLADTTLAVLRRLLRGRSPFDADRGHVHHRLLQQGLSVPRVLAVLYSAASVLALLAILLTMAPETYPIIIVLLAGALIGGIRALNYVELSALASALALSGVRLRIRAHIEARDLEASMEVYEETASSLASLARACAETNLQVAKGPAAWPDLKEVPAEESRVDKVDLIPLPSFRA